ncbi:Glutathione s-transferase [Lasiodiplodia theobromae]|uniref:Glutathione s-transferase n=1 Tax=Lasiodiplodia theobromae TaxID=45133 RepID=UPI0015C3F530|nr:Glutathione s-transferase [Lasiodiplodia theobromae]KAF4545554.1 Glutathione s-transferase [Lasiodiplodia theobromae]
MTLTVHHLQRSQSERIVWLCEELGIDYNLQVYHRERVGLGAPPNLKAIHASGTAPVIEDGEVVISECGAIMDYILGKYGNGRLTLPSTAPNFADYVFWYHWAIGTLQSMEMTLIFVAKAGVPDENPVMQVLKGRLAHALKMMDERLQKAPWLAGDEITAADIYAVFTVTTVRLFTPFALTGYNGILGWLEKIAQRPAYKNFIEKGEQGDDRGELPVLGAEAPRPL